jgi:hypothetical protein
MQNLNSNGGSRKSATSLAEKLFYLYIAAMMVVFLYHVIIAPDCDATNRKIALDAALTLLPAMFYIQFALEPRK